jgi:hypothetical protein
MRRMNHASKKLEVLIPELLDERTKQKQLKFKLSGSGRRRIASLSGKKYGTLFFSARKRTSKYSLRAQGRGFLAFYALP